MLAKGKRSHCHLSGKPIKYPITVPKSLIASALAKHAQRKVTPSTVAMQMKTARVLRKGSI
jgi:hypothetical protein